MTSKWNEGGKESEMEEERGVSKKPRKNGRIKETEKLNSDKEVKKQKNHYCYPILHDHQVSFLPSFP
jgi:hypothetical protein